MASDAAVRVEEVPVPVPPWPDAAQGASRRAGAVLAPVAAAAATLVARLVTSASGPTDWDSAQYALATTRYDVTHGLPQPPGYWLYVVSGRALAVLTGLGAVRALVVVAALASAAGAGLTVVAGRDLGGTWVGLAAGLVVATSPFAWFAGAVVATYSFDLLACALLLVLAWRARPGSWHGLGAVVALALLAGFRQSVVQSFALLAIVAVVASTRSVARALATAAAGAAAAAIWFVPMVVAQPGGLSAWTRATRIEATGAARATSVLDHAPAGATNLGTFAASTVVALAPLAVVGIGALAVLLVRRLRARTPAPAVGDLAERPPRPWYQRRAAVLGAAIVPAALLVSLVQFAKGGYLLAYLPAAVIALLLPVGRLLDPTGRGDRTTTGWLAVATVAVVAVAALGAQRFLDGTGILPDRLVRATGGLWLTQPRYQAPYEDTRSAIRTADAYRPRPGRARARGPCRP